MTRIDDEFPYPLVSTDWLAQVIDRDAVRIIDASWRMPGAPPAALDHEKRRLPGACFFDIDAIADQHSPFPHMLPQQAEFASAVGVMGVGRDDSVVIYDDAGVFSAARVWWTFRVMGHDRVSVLDGGLPKWLKEERSTSSGRASPRAVHYQIDAARPLARDANDVRGLLQYPAGRVVDARAAARFSGAAAEPRQGLRSGHMPGAINLPFGNLLTDTGEMKPLHDLARLFHALDIHTETEIITTCGSGVTAAVISLALERLGHRRHGLYDGSWAEWGSSGNDEDLFPVVSG